MRVLLFVFLSLLICPFLLLIAPAATPTATPTATPDNTAPHVEISADKTTLRVGETVTISGVPVKIGLAIYTLQLSSGGSAQVRYDNQGQSVSGDDPIFEIVSMQAEMYRATFTLRARAAGSVNVSIHASGEVTSAEGAYLWGGGTSPTLTLTITP